LRTDPVTFDNRALASRIAEAHKSDRVDIVWKLDAPPRTNGLRPSFRPITLPELRAHSAAAWLIVDLLPARGLCVLYGEPGSGKSFLALDIAAHPARKRRWAGRRTRKARVVYCALEGHLKQRVAAYLDHHQLEDSDLSDVTVIQGVPLNLLDSLTVDAFIKDVQASLDDYSGPLIIVIDTLARAMPGGNENASEDMGRVIAACAEIERHLNALVILIHHSGKDNSKGARGWSGLRGAADVEIEVTRDRDTRRATFAKVKDGLDGTAVEFKLEVIDLGPRTDIDTEAEPGERITSCVAVVTNENAKPNADIGRMGKYQRMLYEFIRASGPLTRNKAHELMGQAGVPKNRASEAITSLLVRGVIDDIAPAGLTARP